MRRFLIAALFFASPCLAQTGRIYTSNAPSADQIVNSTSSTVNQWTALPSCLDSGGNHINYSTSTHTFSCGTTSSGGGSSAWSALTNPAGNLSLTMAGNTSIFNTTSALAQFFAWKNTTAAVVGTSQGSPVTALCGRAFHGSADVEDCMTFSELPGNGNDAAITFTIGHTGTSTGTPTTSFPGPIQTTGSNAGALVMPQGPDQGTQAANTVTVEAPTAVTSYRLNLPTGNPTNNNSAALFSNATPSIGAFAKMPQTVTLTSQYTNSTTGFTNVTGGNNLAFSLEASTSYTGRCVLFYQAASTGGLNIEFTGPASPTFVTYGLLEESSATALVGSGVATTYSTSLGGVVGTAGTNFMAIVEFGISNGVNAGTLQLLAKSSAAVQLQIQTGSYCSMQ
jgi:hypothetical protein